MTTPNPPATPARPQITLETGREYGPDDVNWLTPEVLAVAACPDDRTPKASSLSMLYSGLNYGIRTGALFEFGAYPIKPGTYRGKLSISFTPNDEDTTSTKRSARVRIDLVVTGDPLGTAFDREVLHHCHPDTAAQDVRITAAQNAATGAATATAAAQTRADAAYKRADTAIANSSSNKEINDSQANAIGVLRGRVDTAEGKILAIEESIANSRED